MFFWLELGMVIMKFNLFFVIALLLCCSCSSDVSYSSDAYGSILNNRLHREISGELAFPKAFTPTSIKAFELDSNLNKGEEIDAAFDVERDAFEIEYRNYSSQYLLIVASGIWKNYDSTGFKVEFETITDISVVDDRKIRLRLLSHLEIPRVKQLMKEGYPFIAAKEKSLRELSVYWDQFAYTNFSEYLVIDEKWKEYFPYMSFFYGGTDSAFVKNIEEFRKNFANGVWQDSVERIKSADYLLKNYYSLSNIMKDWVGDYGDYILDFISNFLLLTYDLPYCSNSGQTFQIYSLSSQFYKDSVVCEELQIYHWYGYGGGGGFSVLSPRMLVRLFTDLEYEIGPCVYDMTVKKEVKEYEGYTYVCSHKGRDFIPGFADVENWKRKE